MWRLAGERWGPSPTAATTFLWVGVPAITIPEPKLTISVLGKEPSVSPLSLTPSASATTRIPTALKSFRSRARLTELHRNRRRLAQLRRHHRTAGVNRVQHHFDRRAPPGSNNNYDRWYLQLGT